MNDFTYWQAPNYMQRDIGKILTAFGFGNQNKTFTRFHPKVHSHMFIFTPVEISHGLQKEATGNAWYPNLFPRPAIVEQAFGKDVSPPPRWKHANFCVGNLCEANEKSVFPTKQGFHFLYLTSTTLETYELLRRKSLRSERKISFSQQSGFSFSSICKAQFRNILT